MPSEIWLVRHGETEWSRSGQHTSRTDLPLTPEGERQAASLKRMLAGHSFALVLSSPMKRAVDTCCLVGLTPEISDDLVEWNYGDYEGLTTPEIQKRVPGWTVWTGASPNGETVGLVSVLADDAGAAAAAEGTCAAVPSAGAASDSCSGDADSSDAVRRARPPAASTTAFPAVPAATLSVPAAVAAAAASGAAAFPFAGVGGAA